MDPPSPPGVDDPPRPSPARPLSEHDAVRILDAAAASQHDRFEILSRRTGKPLTDEQAARIVLSSPSGPRDADASTPLPIAQRSPVPSMPPTLLGYRAFARRGERRLVRPAIETLPMPLRVARVAVWMVVVVVMILALLARGH